ncbi:MAG: hypothetical protein ACREFY_14800 [Acetobacteraceae bacterium]
MNTVKMLTTAIALAGGLAMAAPALAAGSACGTTSGPAVHKPTVPNTAPYKNSGSANTEKTAAANGAGAPGTEAKPGTEAGPATHHSASSGSQSNRG